jgi:hypothetical protein
MITAKNPKEKTAETSGSRPHHQGARRWGGLWGDARLWSSMSAEQGEHEAQHA